MSRCGDRTKLIFEQVTTSRASGPIFANDHGSVSTGLHHVTESVVLLSEIEQLPDLSGYLKVDSRPNWNRLQLHIPLENLSARKNYARPGTTAN
jgi:hypothetical protein